MNLLVAAGSLPAELVARDVKNLKSLSAMCFVERFEFFVLGREATFRSRINDEQHFTFIVGKAHFVAFLVFELKIVDRCHSFSLLHKVMTQMQGRCPVRRWRTIADHSHTLCVFENLLLVCMFERGLFSAELPCLDAKVEKSGIYRKRQSKFLEIRAQY